MPITLDGNDGGKVFTQGNILGTVSQNAGVPTGAIMESGSNSNGWYAKYADGTLICNQGWIESVDVTTSYGGGWYGTISWTYPVAFSVNPSVSAFARASGRITPMAPSVTGGTTSFNFFIWDPAGTHTASYTIRASAIGRWF